jgi:hypothetical protein
MELLDQDTIEKEDGLKVRRPRTPFPFWGPFDSVNAIGRSILLISLFGLACFFMIVVIGSRDYYFGLDGKPFTKLAFILAGVILITIIRGDIFWLLFTIDLLDASTLTAKIRYLLAFLPGLFGILTCLCSIPIMIIISMRKPAVSYQFEHVPLSRLENGMWESTRAFGVLVVLMGIGLLSMWALNEIMIEILLNSDELRYHSAYYGIILPIIIVVSILAALLLAGGILLLMHHNAGRIIIICYLFFFWLVLIIMFCSAIARSPFHRESLTYETPVENLIIYSVMAFGFLVFTYVLLEIKRHLSSPKVIAWCRKGTYVPEWEKQIEDYEKLKTGEELKRSTEYQVPGTEEKK